MTPTVRLCRCWRHARCTVYQRQGRRRKYYVHVAELTFNDNFLPETQISLDKVLRRRYSPRRP